MSRREAVEMIEIAVFGGCRKIFRILIYLTVLSRFWVLILTSNIGLKYLKNLVILLKYLRIWGHPPTPRGGSVRDSKFSQIPARAQIFSAPAAGYITIFLFYERFGVVCDLEFSYFLTLIQAPDIIGKNIQTFLHQLQSQDSWRTKLYFP